MGRSHKRIRYEIFIVCIMGLQPSPSGEIFLYHSKFIRTEFFNTSLSKIDFSNCEVESICVSAKGKELEGVIVNIFQAAELSKILGIVIKEEI